MIISGCCYLIMAYTYTIPRREQGTGEFKLMPIDLIIPQSAEALLLRFDLFSIGLSDW